MSSHYVWTFAPLATVLIFRVPACFILHAVMGLRPVVQEGGRLRLSSKLHAVCAVSVLAWAKPSAARAIRAVPRPLPARARAAEVAGPRGEAPPPAVRPQGRTGAQLLERLLCCGVLTRLGTGLSHLWGKPRCDKAAC